MFKELELKLDNLKKEHDELKLTEHRDIITQAKRSDELQAWLKRDSELLFK